METIPTGKIQFSRFNILKYNWFLNIFFCPPLYHTIITFKSNIYFPIQWIGILFQSVWWISCIDSSWLKAKNVFIWSSKTLSIGELIFQIENYRSTRFFSAGYVFFIINLSICWRNKTKKLIFKRKKLARNLSYLCSTDWLEGDSSASVFLLFYNMGLFKTSSFLKKKTPHSTQ